MNEVVLIYALVAVAIGLMGAALWQLRKLNRRLEPPKRRGPGFWEKVWNR